MSFHVSVHFYQNSLVRLFAFTTAVKGQNIARTHGGQGPRMSAGRTAGATSGKTARAGAHLRLPDSESDENDFQEPKHRRVAVLRAFSLHFGPSVHVCVQRFDHWQEL